MLPDNFENLVMTGSGDDEGYGNSLKNVIIGNSGNNILNGFGGADRMVGGVGNDASGSTIAATKLKRLRIRVSTP